MNVHYGDVLIKYGSILDVESDEIPYIAAGKESKKQCYLSDGDVIIADTAEDETVGKCTEITNTKNAKIEAGLHTIPCHPRTAYAPMFLGYYMNSPYYHKQLIPLMQGVKVLSVSKSNIGNTLISAPISYSEQEKIVDMLHLLDCRMRKQQEAIDNLKKYKRGLLYTIEAGFQDCVQYTRLGELFSVQGGFAFKSEFFGGSGNTVIRISDINNGIVSTQNAVSYPLSIKIDERFIVQKGDLLIAMSGATTGKTGIYNENKKSYLNQRVGKFVCKSETYSLEYLSEILESSSFSKSLKNLLIAGAQPNISPSDIESIPIPIFNKDVSKHITGLLHKYSLLILQEEKLLASLLQMRKGVAQQLFI